MSLNADLIALAITLCPTSRVDLTAKPSEATAAQGQFSSIDASTEILSATTATVALNVILDSTPFAALSEEDIVDDRGMLLIFVDQGTDGQTVDSITVTTGTLVYQQVGTRFGMFVVSPNDSAQVSASITLSAGNANTRVTLVNRTFNATNIISTV